MRKSWGIPVASLGAEAQTMGALPSPGPARGVEATDSWEGIEPGQRNSSASVQAPYQTWGRIWSPGVSFCVKGAPLN